MPHQFSRYAVFYSPQRLHSLSTFARGWFGFDPEKGLRVELRETLGLSWSLIESVTSEPARYSLHATLKAPFSLVTSRHLKSLRRATETLANSLSPITTGPLELTNLDGFLALCPTDHLQALSNLATRCVKELDMFRTPMSNEERERRIATTKLSPHQIGLLSEWGYPFVLDQFRFHITLTRRLTEMEQATLVPALKTRLERELRHPLTVDSICLYGDPGNDLPFLLIDRYALSG